MTYTVTARTTEGEHIPLDHADDKKAAQIAYRIARMRLHNGNYAESVTAIELHAGDQIIATTDQEGPK